MTFKIDLSIHASDLKLMPRERLIGALSCESNWIRLVTDDSLWRLTSKVSLYSKYSKIRAMSNSEVCVATNKLDLYIEI